MLTSLFYSLASFIEEDISGREGEDSPKCESEAWEVAGWGIGLHRSQGSEWDARRAQSIQALKHWGPLSAGFLTVSIVSYATKCLILF